MFDNKKFLAVIPAQGGSTRLPKKNIRNLLGKPLISWTIQSAKKSNLLDKILVSTDDEEIKNIAKNSNIEIHHRSPELANEFSLIVDTLNDIILKYSGFNILVLNPTSPIRNDSLIDDCIEKFSKNNYDSLASGIYVNYIPWPTSMKRSQDLEKYFIDNGAVYVYKESLIQKKSLISKNFGILEVPKNEYVDIDTEDDLKIASLILNERIKQGIQ